MELDLCSSYEEEAQVGEELELEEERGSQKMG
jgi:hypothetical protein